MKTKKHEPMIIKFTHKDSRIDDIGDYNAKVARGTGFTPNKKRLQKDFRKEKHKAKFDY